MTKSGKTKKLVELQTGEAFKAVDATIAPPTPTGVIAPSMSKSELLLICQYPWGRVAPKSATASPEAMYGSAFHDVLAAKLMNHKVDISGVAAHWSTAEAGIDATELREHTRHALEELRRWLSGLNPWKFDFAKKAKARVEFALGLNVEKLSARKIRPPTEEGHRYVDVNKGELPGTADLVLDEIAGGKTTPDLIVLDHKTGEDPPMPLDSMQLFSLTLAEMRRSKRKRPAMAIFHAPRGGGARVYADEVTPGELVTFGKKLQAAWARIGDGSLTPGSHCVWCPGLTICPAHQQALAVVTSQGGAMELTAEKVGFIDQQLQIFDAFSKRAREEIVRPWIREHGSAVRPDGKLAVLREVTRENLSMASVRRALGGDKGEEEIDRLRKLGCVEASTFDQIARVNDE